MTPDTENDQGGSTAPVRDEPDTTREVTDTRVVHGGAVFDFRADTVRLSPDAEPVVREYIDHPGAVGVVAVRGGEGAEEVCVVRQYRHPVRARLWEVPAGLRDVDGEAPHRTAARELREEADLEAGTWHVLLDILNSPGATSEGLRLFLARDVRELDEAFEREHEEAEMEARWVALDELVEAALAGRLHNATLVGGVLATAAARARGWTGLRPAEAPWEITGRREGT